MSIMLCDLITQVYRIRSRIEVNEDTVELVHNGHLGERGKWPLSTKEWPFWGGKGVQHLYICIEITNTIKIYQ